jgi:hypothetical protein
MDISLLAISPDRTSQLAGQGHPPSASSCEIQWAGAYNSLWYLENGKMKEIPADKQPIGKSDNPKPFTTHTFALHSARTIDNSPLPTTLYLFTDGFADQFGGQKGKKYKYKQLQQLIVDNGQLTMGEQKQMLEKEFDIWKGDLEQVDDVLVIGIRV